MAKKINDVKIPYAYDVKRKKKIDIDNALETYGKTIWGTISANYFKCIYCDDAISLVNGKQMKYFKHDPTGNGHSHCILYSGKDNASSVTRIKSFLYEKREKEFTHTMEYENGILKQYLRIPKFDLRDLSVIKNEKAKLICREAINPNIPLTNGIQKIPLKDDVVSCEFVIKTSKESTKFNYKALTTNSLYSLKYENNKLKLNRISEELIYGRHYSFVNLGQYIGNIEGATIKLIAIIKNYYLYEIMFSTFTNEAERFCEVRNCYLNELGKVEKNTPIQITSISVKTPTISTSENDSWISVDIFGDGKKYNCLKIKEVFDNSKGYSFCTDTKFINCVRNIHFVYKTQKTHQRIKPKLVFTSGNDKLIEFNIENKNVYIKLTDDQILSFYCKNKSLGICIDKSCSNLLIDIPEETFINNKETLVVPEKFVKYKINYNEIQPLHFNNIKILKSGDRILTCSGKIQTIEKIEKNVIVFEDKEVLETTNSSRLVQVNDFYIVQEKCDDLDEIIPGFSKVMEYYKEYVIDFELFKEVIFKTLIFKPHIISFSEGISHKFAKVLSTFLDLNHLSISKNTKEELYNKDGIYLCRKLFSGDEEYDEFVLKQSLTSFKIILIDTDNKNVERMRKLARKSIYIDSLFNSFKLKTFEKNIIDIEKSIYLANFYYYD